MGCNENGAKNGIVRHRKCRLACQTEKDARRQQGNGWMDGTVEVRLIETIHHPPVIFLVSPGGTEPSFQSCWWSLTGLTCDNLSVDQLKPARRLLAENETLLQCHILVYLLSHFVKKT
jgi:hypothetical protein